MRILVIGAGASGLVTAKVAVAEGHEVCIVELGNRVGGTFENKRYQDAQMVSSKHLTLFSDFRPTSDTAMHMKLADYVVYLEEYAAHFDITKLIRFHIKVLNVQKSSGKDTYEVTLQADGDDSHPQTEEWDAVAVCSGLHNTPRIPNFPGQESFTGTVLHSATYKDPSIFRNKRVLIIGTGETAFDLGWQAANNGAEAVTMSTRHGFVSVPAFFGANKPPLDCVIMNYATHAWESKWAQRVGMHWWVTTKFTRLGFLISTGCSYGFNQWTGKRFNLTWDEGRKHIVNKSARCMPLISRKKKKEAHWLWRTIYSWTDTSISHIPIDIDLVEGSVDRFEKEAVCYNTEKGEKRVEVDLVVLATGYRQRFPFLMPEGGSDDPLPERHFMINDDEPKLAYIGFIRPNVGAIPPMSELQAMWWCQKLKGALKPGSELDQACYRLSGSRLSYGVDYGYYMFAIAREIGAVPSLRYWFWHNWRIMVTCAFGQAHVPIFRLQGPYADAGAQATCSGELFQVILSRPFVMNFLFLYEAFCFGVMNGVATMLESTKGQVGLLSAGMGLYGALRYRNAKLAM